ncbi:MAG: DHHA1 domain-containing protein [Lutisporaceae bacterium]
MSTQKLYYFDSYLTEFQANIIEIIPYQDKYAIIMDKTYFYPESGGQPSDIGTINSVSISYVVEQENKILHIADNKLELGPVSCKIDWDNRFYSMQQHSGQHILSACFYKLYQGETSSFHIGKDTVTIEIDIESFNADMAEQVEEMANSMIYNNHIISTDIVDKDKLTLLPLRKQPKVTSNIRIVDIEGCDCSPCGGTHVKATGEIGIIKIKRWEKLKNSHKFEFICGIRALKDYRYKNTLVNKLGAYLSASEQDVEKAFLKFTEDYKGLQKQVSQFRNELVTYDAHSLMEQSIDIGGLKVISKILENRDFNEIKLIAQIIVSNPSKIALLATSNEGSQLIFTRSDDTEINMNNLLKSILPIINGKGGGSSKAAQGGGSGDIQAALASAVESLKTL